MTSLTSLTHLTIRLTLRNGRIPDALTSFIHCLPLSLTSWCVHNVIAKGDDIQQLHKHLPSLTHFTAYTHDDRADDYYNVDIITDEAFVRSNDEIIRLQSTQGIRLMTCARKHLYRGSSTIAITITPPHIQPRVQDHH
jgi:hypothetical protein